jgi:cysteinyl-tRNA synthetase
MANYWLHNGFLQVEGEKMAKSLGNFVTIHELLRDWVGYKWPGEALRFNMLKTHYRQPLDWTYSSLDEAHGILWEWYGDLKGKDASAAGVPGHVLDALSDDLNTPKAIAAMHELHSAGKWPELRAALGLLGFSGDRDKMVRIPAIDFGDENNVRLTVRMVGSLSGTAQEAMIKDLIHSRMIARQAKKFDVADQIRDELAAMGIELKDAKDPKTGELVTTWEVAR